MKKFNGSAINMIAVLMLFCMFAASVLMTLMLGARTYNATKERGDASYNKRTCVSYVAEKVRHADSLGGVYVRDYYGEDALYIEEDYDGITFVTIIYHYDGYMCELFTEKGYEFEPDCGEAVIEIGALEFNMLRDNMLEIGVTDISGSESTLTLTLRGGAEL